MRRLFATTAILGMVGIVCTAGQAWGAAVAAGPSAEPNIVVASRDYGPIAFGGLNFSPVPGTLGLTQTATIAPGLDLGFTEWRVESGGLPFSTISPFAPFAADGFGFGVSLPIADDIHLRLDQATILTGGQTLPSLLDPLQPQFITGLPGSRALTFGSAALEWSFSDWGSLGVVASRGLDQLSLIDGISGPAVSATESSALGISARVGFGEGWVTTIAVSEGVSNLNSAGGALVPNMDPVRSQAYGLAIAKHGLFGDDALGISVSRPLQSATNIFALANPSSTGLVNKAPESDIQLGYVTTFLDGALALQANAGYQVNVNGDKGQDAVSGVARAKINF